MSPGVNHSSDPRSTGVSLNPAGPIVCTAPAPSSTRYASEQTRWTWGLPPRRPSGPSQS